MSDTPNNPTEIASSSADYPKLDMDNVRKTLVDKRMKGISRKNKIILGAIILLIVAGSGYFINKSLGSKEKTGYATSAVAKGTVSDVIEATGTLKATMESELGFENDDTITAINVKPGDRVTKGQVLAQQATTTLENSLLKAQSALEQDQLSLKSATLSHERNLKTLERQQQLFEAGSISQTDLESAQQAVEDSEISVSNAQLRVANDQIEVEQAQADLSDATLVAPFDGIIGEVNGQVGQINGLNSSTATLLNIMSDVLEMTALVNEADIGRVKVGQDVEFTSSAYADEVFKGKVETITPQATTVSNVQYYSVLISVEDPKGLLYSGMSVSAKIIVERASDVLTVPMMAVTYGQTYARNNPGTENQAADPNAEKPAAKDNTVPVNAANGEENSQKVSRVVVLENDQPVVKKITIGISDGTNYAVLEGLKEGDKVILGTNTVSGNAGSATSSGNANSSNNNNRRQTTTIRTNAGGPPGM